MDEIFKLRDNPLAAEAERAIRRIVNKTKKDMEALNTFRPQFLPAIRAYAEMRHQLDRLNQEFYADGCRITEEYTNKAGATNIRKTALYLAIETLRREIAGREESLGLTPSGMRKINEREMRSKPKVSKLEKALTGGKI